ncbi:ribulokinase [Acuticoccus sp. I52.16.1]|uniref:ribulokinase n=1 Tax=Acuticoccus sp. I52.16.1 TaxID=2928472 RepID=UPI001FCF8CC6|nr:ribulokinase [Acuticoccus sp. I52.16.1]UOM36228.1 ribulokinase [Acuticoccus sp. I52.16.1]
MAIVAGVDFGTLSVRVTLMETSGTHLGTAVASYPLHTDPADPYRATQSHADHMAALAEATRAAVADAGIDGRDVAAIACDTTGSSVIPVDAAMQPVGEYYLWCDHRAHREAAEITATFRGAGHEAIDWCGGVYSHEWGYAKLLHFLRHDPEAGRMASAFEHCDMVAATLAGVTRPEAAKRSVCAMGHKWMWNPRWGGLPPASLLAEVDPLLAGINDRLVGEVATSDRIAGHLCPEWAERLGLAAGIPIPVGAFDAHWDAIGAGCRMGDIVNVVGTSTCIIAEGPAEIGTIPGLCGLVPGSVHPAYMGVEAGQSATGDVFDAIARRAGRPLSDLAAELIDYRAGQTGLMRIPWDNGDRTVLVRPDLGGVTLGWSLASTAADELFAAIEGMALHVGVILDRMGEGGVPADRIINAGGVPQRGDVLNQVYADALGREILVPAASPVGVGSCVFAGLAAGAFATVEEGQAALCPPMRTYAPDPAARAVYDALFALFRDVYFALGEGRAVDLGRVLPELHRLRG